MLFTGQTTILQTQKITVHYLSKHKQNKNLADFVVYR